MQHLEISRAWGGLHLTLLVTDFQWLGTADVVAGSSWEEQNQSLGASLSLTGTCFPTTALLTFCTDALAVLPASSAAQSGFLSLVFTPTLVGYCFV